MMRASCCIAFLFTWGVFPLEAATQNRPQPKLNFIIVHVDDMGWKDLGCQGSQFYLTPNIDKLAKRGMRFTNAYAAAAICSPTRAALMTGRYPARLGVTDWIRARFQRGGRGTPKRNPTEYVGGPNRRLLCPPNPYWMELEEVTIAEILRELGYATCHIGKWHLGDDAWYPQHQGFQFNYGGCDYGQPPNYFDPFQSRRLKQGIPGLPPRKIGEYLSDREADEAVNFIKKHQNKPFFLYLAHYAVHTPIQAKADVTEKYKQRLATLPKSNKQKNPKYAAMVESVDDAMGRILAVLQQLNLDEKTVIIFTSDNGGLLGPTNNYPLRSGKGFPYEGGIRVPLIVRWPGTVPPGKTSEEPVISVDYLPTIAEAAGAKLPQNRKIDGVSLVKHLRSGGKTKLPRDAIYWHFPHYRSGSPYSIIRKGDWKLTKFYEGPRMELYNLKNDLGEKNDLAKKHPQKAKELHRDLQKWLKDVNAKLPRPNPKYRPKNKKRSARGPEHLFREPSHSILQYTEIRGVRIDSSQLYSRIGRQFE
ncbi:MAG: sulfatase [Gemmataceae bacterium]